tara:strand:+ start:131 stop:478 length:348 start_codon:yes stop_codon:yes gene_type:complete
MKKRLKNYVDDRGLLFSFYKEKYNFKRIFFISGKKNKIRGDHAHKTLTQILVNIDSHTKIKIGKDKLKTVTFSKPGEYIICPKKHWLKIHFLSKGTIAVLCDKKYEKEDYIYKKI